MKTELVLLPEDAPEGTCPETDTSLHKSDCQKLPDPPSAKHSKKRIGPFSFYLHDVIGRGFSSVVYRGVKDNDKSQSVALKVVPLQGMSAHRRLLLENQVKILKMVTHPHIVALLDIYYTANNCYIIMEYCEGGSLQARIDAKQEVNWAKAAHEVGMACRYLASLNIMHRDIKPANVFMKEGVCKLGDFGFACQLGGVDQTLQQKYLIGSPLYMSPQALAKNLYSVKGDAFAFGVFLYYIATGRFPWKGKDKHQLIEQYQKRPASQRHLHALPPKFKHFVNGLLERTMEKRWSIQQLDFDIFGRLRKVVSIEGQLLEFESRYEYQIKACQFIHFLMVNFQKWQHVNYFLIPLMSKHLGQLVQVFGWQRHPYLSQLKSRYILPVGQFEFSSDQYHWLNNCIKDTLSHICGNAHEDFSQGMVLKLLQYQRLVQSIMYGKTQEISAVLQSLTLHQSFELLRPSASEVCVYWQQLDFYQL